MSPNDPAASPWAPNDWPGDAPWQALPVAARQSFLVSALIGWGMLGLIFGGFAALGWVLAYGLSWAVLAVALPALPLAAGLAFWQSGLAWRYTRWRLDEDGLRLRRGRWWRQEVMVPRARIQHLDIERGPIERRFGLATLVLHTAATVNSALRQAGFAEDDAMHLREILVPQRREHDDESRA